MSLEILKTNIDSKERINIRTYYTTRKTIIIQFIILAKEGLKKEDIEKLLMKMECLGNSMDIGYNQSIDNKTMYKVMFKDEDDKEFEWNIG